MQKLFKLIALLCLAMVFAASAATEQYTLYLNTDGVDTGQCAAVGGLNGADAKIDISVNDSPKAITAVSLSTCNNSAFTPPSPLNLSDWSLTPGAGPGGSDIVEGKIPLTQLGNPAAVAIFAASSVNGVAVDIAGNGWAGITLNAPQGNAVQPIPALSTLALGLLLAVLFALSWFTYRRRYARYHWLLLLVCLPALLTVAWALSWTTVVTDAKESGNGGDMRVIKLAADGGALYIQLAAHIGTSTPGNHAPTDIALSNTSVAENAAGAVIGNLSTVDPDAGDTHTYSVSDNRFDIFYNAPDATLILKAGQALDYEAEPTVSLTITTTDNGGLTFSKAFTLTVIDDPSDNTPGNHAPTNISLSNTNVSENAAGALVGYLSTVDPDAGDSHTYSVSDNRFMVIFGNQLRLQLGQALDYETEPTLTLTITTTDSSGLTFSKAFTINVIDDPTDNSSTGKLNDTGIIWGGNYPNGSNADCSGVEITAQDCSHGRDARALAGTLTKIGGGEAGFDFTKLDNSGNALPASAATWACVRDNVTGLVWEVKTDDNGLHDKDNAYSWYNSDNGTNGGDAGTQNGGSCNGSDCDTAAFAAAVNSAGLCGQSDWRLPSREELRTITNLLTTNPAIDTAYFPNTLSRFYWSSSPAAGGNSYAWGVSFNNGYDNGDDKAHSRYVRLVRGL